MTYDNWEALARRRAGRAQPGPSSHGVRALAWAVGGYAFLFATLAATAAAGVGIVVAVFADSLPVTVLPLALPFLAVAWLGARALFVRVAPPAGIELDPADAPALFASIERLRLRLRTPRIDHVVVDGEFNASIARPPVLGPFCRRTWLTLGLPYMQALSPDELEAAIARELGHVSRRRGRVGSWTWTAQHGWMSVARELDERGSIGSDLALVFYEWYLPRLRAYGVAREHEREADRASAEVVGPRPGALALLRSVALAPTVEAYRDDVVERMSDEPEPPAGLYRELAAALREPPSDVGRRVLRARLAEPTAPTDTHPALGERLAALGYSGIPWGLDLAPPQASAAEALLGPAGHASLCDRLGRDWCDALRARWAERHAEAGRERERLAALDAADRLDVAGARERAELVERRGDAAAALEAWRDVLALDAADGRANLVVGSRLLERDDDRGIGLLARAIDASPLIGVWAAGIASTWLCDHGRTVEAARFHERFDVAAATLNAARAERRRELSRGDALEPHDLSADAVAALTSSLARMGRVTRAYIVRKRVEHLADDAPQYVLGVKRKTIWTHLGLGDLDRKLVARVHKEVELPRGTLTVALAVPNLWLRRRFERIDGALVYKR